MSEARIGCSICGRWFDSSADARAHQCDGPARCGVCRFWPRSGYGEQNNIESGLAGSDRSECRRRAPVVGADGDRPIWPWVDRREWCGEFERRQP